MRKIDKGKLWIEKILRGRFEITFTYKFLFFKSFRKVKT